MEKYVEMQLRKKEAEQQQRHATVEDNFDGNNFKTVDSVFEIGMFRFVCSCLTYLRNTYNYLCLILLENLVRKVQGAEDQRR